MSRKISVPSRSKTTLDFVEGDLLVGRRAVIDGTGTPPTVKVSGTVYCEGDNIFDCNLSAENLEAEDNVTVHGDLEIENDIKVEDGRLEVYGKMTAKRVDIDAALYVTKDLAVEKVDIGGSLKVDGNVKAEDIDVGGSFKARGEVETEKIDVGGSVSIESQVDIARLDVGGTAKVGGGKSAK